MANSVDAPLSARLAQIAGITASTFLSGTLLGLSLLSMPILLRTSPPPLLLQQWKQIFDAGKSQGPFLAITAGATFAYAAYQNHQQGQDWTGYAVAGALTVGIVPYTLVLMSGVNGRLMNAAVVGTDVLETAQGGEEIRRWVKTWTGLNGVRGLLPLAGGIVGLWSLMR